MSLVIALVLACAHPAPELLPTPFTAEQARDAMPVGGVIELTVEQLEDPALRMRWEVVAADGEGLSIASTTSTADGTVLDGPTEQHSTWVELRLRTDGAGPAPVLRCRAGQHDAHHDGQVTWTPFSG